MKTKTISKIYQGIILLGILIIELIGFQNEWKYNILCWVHPWLSNCFTSNIILIKVFIIALLIVFIAILWIKLKKSDEEPLFIIYLIKGFQVKGSDMIGVFNVIFIICSISWIGSEIYKYTPTSYLNAFIYACFMILYPLIIANYLIIRHPPRNRYNPKILLYAISNLEEKFLRLSLLEMEEKFSNQWRNQVFYNEDGSMKRTPNGVPWGPWGNFDPIRKSIIVHNALFDEIILIISSEASVKIDLLNDDLKPLKLVTDFLDKFFPNHKIQIKIISEEISGNDMKTNLTGLKNILNSLFVKKINDRDLLFNITGGTAAMSGAMILCSIPGERHAEYARQDTGVIDDIPLDINDVKVLWKELLEKVG